MRSQDLLKLKREPFDIEDDRQPSDEAFNKAKKDLEEKQKKCAACRGQHRAHTCNAHEVTLITVADGKILCYMIMQALKDQRKQRFVFGKRLVYTDARNGSLMLAVSWDTQQEIEILRRCTYALHSKYPNFHAQSIAVQRSFWKGFAIRSTCAVSTVCS